MTLTNALSRKYSPFSTIRFQIEFLIHRAHLVNCLFCIEKYVTGHGRSLVKSFN